MAEEVLDVVSEQVSQFGTLPQLISSSTSLQIALTILIIGIITIVIAYRGFANLTKKQKFSYTKPHFARLIRVGILPFFAIALISSVNVYIQTTELFNDSELTIKEFSISDTFAKTLNTINVLVIGYTIAHLIPIFLNKLEKSNIEKEDFVQWKDLRGFKDDNGDLFHRLYKWIPPKNTPDGLDESEFRKLLQTKEGRKKLESLRTKKGYTIGSYGSLVKNPFEEFKKSEREKYEKYYNACFSGSNESGKNLKLGQEPEEIYQVDIWREEKRLNHYDQIIPGGRPVGYAARKRKDLPKSYKQILPVGIFVVVVLGVLSWWGVDLFVLATATGGFAIGLGLALQETMQNYFAYIMIRKDKIFVEGDRIQLETDFNGYVHKITPRVTYVRHALNESYAVIPTRNLVNSQIINYSKELKTVPALVEVGVSYLNNPRQVAAILVKTGKRAMKQLLDDRGKHLVVQNKCPYLEQNLPSCGCDKEIIEDLNQPVVRFNQFNDSSLDFVLWVYVRDYGSQFKVETEMRMIMYEEFKKYDIRIPWPIRTVYQGDEKKEFEEISKLDSDRNKVIDEYGIGDIGRGGGED
ncbi:MAG TPA: mechanosensitive ion channel [Nitrosopumilus sp.]|nr:mechanosensitive ion channel [Thermoproteota archaeon]HJJ22269.1 mechanosensitive ion channel [Nitrosopumilus sp.]